MPLTCLVLNIGGGGLVLGAEMAGFDIAAVGMCHWHEYERIQKILPDTDLLGTTIDSCHAGLVVLGLNSGSMFEQRIKDQRADALEQIIHKVRPQAVLIAAEPAAFAIEDRFRVRSLRALRRLGFRLMTREYAACELGLAISRKVRFLVAMRPDLSDRFIWPEASVAEPATVSSVLADLMVEGNWSGIAEWKRVADRPAPPLMLRAPRHSMATSADGRLSDAWSSIGIDGSGIADAAPSADFVGLPRLTVGMLMRLYTYPSSYEPPETKTALLRLLSSDSPPAMVAAVAAQIRHVIEGGVEMNEMPADQANSTSSAPPGTAV